MTLSILIWLPAIVRPRRRVPAAGRGRAVRRRRRAGHARRRDLVRGPVQARPPRTAVRHRRGVDRRAGDPLQARRRRPQHRAAAADDDPVRGLVHLGLAARVGPAAGVLLPPRARRGRGARCVLRPGPGAVRGVLRPDADPVLLPDRDVGHRRAGAGDAQARHLHAGGVVPDARGGDRHRRARLLPERHLADVRAQLAPAPAAVARLPGVDLPVLRRGVPGEDAAGAVPRLARRRLQGDADPGGGGVLRGPLEGRRLRLPADRAAAVPLRRASTSRR